MTREKPEIDRLLDEGHKPISIRNGVEYVFRLQVEEKTVEVDRIPGQIESQTRKSSTRKKE